jgi:hypothetical protein
MVEGDFLTAIVYDHDGDYDWTVNVHVAFYGGKNANVHAAIYGGNVIYERNAIVHVKSTFYLY